MLNFKEIEEKTLKFWKQKKIYEKSRRKNKRGKNFYFLQGPPYTSGKLHIGQAWNNSMKDILLRYKRMQGFNVWDRAGYDMHGLPTENRVQKELKLKDKKAILDYGLSKFIRHCLKISTETAKIMSEDLLRLGIWLDYKNAYLPVEDRFIEGEWWFIKKAHEQKRLYKGKKVMQWCAHCETALAKHELEYENAKDNSIFLKFKIKGKEKEYLIVWTTTPWTIPYNLAVMVNPGLDYVKVEVDGEKWILAKSLANVFVGGLLGKKYKVIEKIKGDKLEGIRYEHPFYWELEEQFKGLGDIHKVILSEQYVDATAGSGMVHCAPGCGPEDYEVGAENGIRPFNNLDEKGYFRNMGKFSDLRAKEDDEKFVEYLEEKGNLIAETQIEHEYPYCWRCHKPVVFRATEQWFLKIEDLKKKLLNFNKSVNWVPKFTKRNYDLWTENLKDNSITRQRYWGTPVPIWECECGNVEVIGSIEELKKKAKKLPENLHKPWIDKIGWKCKCGKEMKRIPDIIDVWIDSGTTGWNCLYYPRDKKHIKLFPADFILEATEQIRLWFSMLQICSSIAMKKSAYKSVYCHGMIFDFEGTKMSKSLGNIISPYEVIDKYSSDVLRFYICQTTAGENINFSWEDVKQKQRNLLVFWNLHKLLLDLKDNKKTGKVGIEEKYIISRLDSSIKKTTELFENYELDKTIGEVEKLFLDLSRVYIQLTRERSDEKVVYETLKKVYIECLKMFSPICPFITDAVWQELKKKKIVKEESVHFCRWPKPVGKINKKLEQEFSSALEIIEAGLAARSDANIGLKWPLAKAEIKTEKKIERELQEIIKRQLNVKNLEIKKGKLVVSLDTRLTSELEMEGFSREIARKVQAARKKAGLVKKDKIDLVIITDLQLSEQEGFIRERTNASKILIAKKIINTDEKKHKNKMDVQVKKKKIKILFTKL